MQFSVNAGYLPANDGEPRQVSLSLERVICAKTTAYRRQRSSSGTALKDLTIADFFKITSREDSGRSFWRSASQNRNKFYERSCEFYGVSGLGHEVRAFINEFARARFWVRQQVSVLALFGTLAMILLPCTNSCVSGASFIGGILMKDRENRRKPARVS